MSASSGQAGCQISRTGKGCGNKVWAAGRTMDIFESSGSTDAEIGSHRPCQYGESRHIESTFVEQQMDSD